MATRIQQARRPVPAALASRYHAALHSLAQWEDLCRDGDSLGFPPLLVKAALAGGIMAISYITWIFFRVQGELIPAVESGIDTIRMASEVAVWTLLGMVLYNFGTKGKLF